MAEIFKKIEKGVRRLFEPISKQIPFSIKKGIFKGLKLKGALVYINCFKDDDAEDLFYKNYDFSNKVIYDIGAHIGVMTLYFSKETGKKGKVYSFEPNPTLGKLLNSNIKMNKLENVESFPYAIGNQDGEVNMNINVDHQATGTLSSSNASKNSKLIIVKSYKLDSIFNNMGLKSPDFIKIDTEGFEINVLEGAKQIITKIKPDLFIEMHNTEFEKVFNFLKSVGYKINHIEKKIEINKQSIDKMKYGHIYCNIPI